MTAKGLKPKNRKEYTLIIKEMGKVYSSELLKNGIVQLPKLHGDIYIKDKSKKPLVKYYRDEKKVYFNEHTDGITKTFFWLSEDRKSKKCTRWSFSPNKSLRKGMAIELRDKKRVYPDFDKMLNRK